MCRSNKQAGGWQNGGAGTLLRKCAGLAHGNKGMASQYPDAPVSDRMRGSGVFALDGRFYGPSPERTILDGAALCRNACRFSCLSNDVAQAKVGAQRLWQRYNKGNPPGPGLRRDDSD